MTAIDRHYSRFYGRMQAGITPIDPKTVRKAAIVKRTDFDTPLRAEIKGLTQLAFLFKESHESHLSDTHLKTHTPLS